MEIIKLVKPYSPLQTELNRYCRRSKIQKPGPVLRPSRPSHTHGKTRSLEFGEAHIDTKILMFQIETGISVFVVDSFFLLTYALCIS